MTWRTHLVIGANSLWFINLSQSSIDQIAILIPAALIASLLPDLDATSAKIHYVAGGAFGGFRGIFEHRGIFHSIFATLIIFALLFSINFFALHNAYPLLPFIFTLSYLSHPVIDGLNAGVGYLYPFKKRKYALLPQSLLSPVKGSMDNLLFFIGAFGVMLFLVLYMNTLRLDYL